jgi:hypothetical protein
MRRQDMDSTEVFRFERKFVVTETAADAIQQFVSSYLSLDEHMAGAESIGYRVCSLYLDTPQLSLYRQSAEGIKNRRKLRIRFYDDRPDNAAYLEIKRRTGETVHKLRATVCKSGCEALLRGERLTVADLCTSDDVGCRALDEFCECKQRYDADGVVFVDYRRIAYVSGTGDNTRVTFDRHLVAREFSPGSGLMPGETAAPVPVHGVVLELKYNCRATRWMHDLVQTFNLQRRSFPKYVFCADALNLAEMHGRVLAGGAVR